MENVKGNIFPLNKKQEIEHFRLFLYFYFLYVYNRTILLSVFMQLRFCKTPFFFFRLKRITRVFFFSFFFSFFTVFERASILFLFRTLLFPK